MSCYFHTALHVRQGLGVGGEQIVGFAISPVWA